VAEGEPVPEMMNPPMPTLSPACTRIRVEMFRKRAGVGAAVALGVGALD
jgi:hypothetical protein